MYNWVEILNDYKNTEEPFALVTITKCVGSTPCTLGARMIVTKDKKIAGTIGGGKLEHKVIIEALEAIKNNKIIESTYTLGPQFEQCCGGKVELIMEPMNQSPELFLFGAGHIGVEVCNLLVNTPFKLHLIDSRKNWLSKLNLDKTITPIDVDLNDFKTFTNAVNWGPNCYVVVMTHDHKIDFEIIAMALIKKTKYLGLIGSKTKRVRFNNMLKKEMSIADGMKDVVCPLGLKIGGDTPKEIAISIIAQLLQTHYKLRTN